MAKATKKEAAHPEKPAKSKKDSAKKGKEPAVAEASLLKRGVQFSKDAWGEFQKIQWPTPRHAMNQSVVVLFTVILIILLVNLYDFISGFLLGFIL